MTRTFTGRHMAAILVAFFAVVIGVNFTMAAYASSTFGGIVVENSYVASQHFNRWLDEAAAEQALGWKARAERLPDGKVAVELAGAPAGATLVADARHPLGRLPDTALHFIALGGGRFVSREALPAGRWTLRLEARAGRSVWRAEEPLA
jgi:nitrogen fixation protein FixH